MLKRWSCLILGAICFVLFGNTAAWAEGYLPITNNGNAVTATSWALLDDACWVSADSSVYQVDLTSGESTWLPVRDQVNIAGDQMHIVAWGKQLLLCDWQNGQILTVGETTEQIVAFAFPAIEKHGVFSQPVCTGDSLFVCVSSNEMQKAGKLYHISLSSGGAARLIDTGVFEIAAWTGESVLALKYDVDQRVYQFYTISSDGQASLVAETEGIDVSCLASVPDRETFYFLNGTVLCEYAQGSLRELRSIPKDQHVLLAAATDDGYFLLSENKGIGRFDLSGSQEQRLVIRGIYSSLADIDFSTSHPDIALMRIPENTLYAQDIYSDILTGDSSVDLYYLPFSSGVKALIEQGYIEPLTGSKALGEDHASLYEVLGSSLVFEDKLYAVPACVEYGNWMLTVDNPQDFTAPQTLTGALDSLRTWEDAESNVGQSFLGVITEDREWTALDWLDMALTQLLLGRAPEERIDLTHNHQLSDVLEAVKKAYEEQGLPLIPDDAQTFSWDKAAALMSFGGSNGYYGIGLNTLTNHAPYNAQPVPMPSLMDDEPGKYPAVMTVFVLNPLSEHKEEALSYLEWVVENRNAQDQTWLRSDSVPTLRSHIAKRLDSQEMTEAQRQSLMENPSSWEVDESLLSFYREEILPNMVVLADSLLERSRMTTQAIYPEFLQQFSRFLMGQQSADQCLSQIQRIIDSWWMENQ